MKNNNYNFDFYPKSTSELKDKSAVSVTAFKVDSFNQMVSLVLEKNMVKNRIELTFIEAKELGLINLDALKSIPITF